MGSNETTDNAEARLAKTFNFDDGLGSMRLVSGGPANAKNESLLDVAMDHTVKPALGLVMSNEKSIDTVAGYTKQFVKMTPIFMKGNLSVIGLATAYAADEVKYGAPLQEQLIDGGLGVGKGLALKGAFSLMGQRGMTPAMSGVQLGIIQRTSDIMLTRSNYYEQGQFSAANVMGKAAKAALKPEMLAMDAAAFGAADVLWGRMYLRTRGSIYHNPVLKHAVAGGTMGAASGAGYEAVRQLETGKFDPMLLAQRSIGEGFVGTLAGGVGGYQTRLSRKVSPGVKAHQEAPGFMDAEQKAFRDGQFAIEKKATGINFNPEAAASGALTMEAWTGRLTKPNGQTVPAIFRPNDGTPAFQNRMNVEVSGYAANKGAGLGDSMPVAVARSVEVGGKTYSGYIQEMGGVDLHSYLNKQAIAKFGSGSTDNMVKVFKQDVALQNAVKGALGERIVFGEWDNHALNLIVRETEAGRVVKNIDMADALKPAKSVLDTTPDAGFLHGWEGLNSRLYAELAGKKITPVFKDNLQSFLHRYDSPTGRVQLQQQSGWSHAQMEGVIGRSKWFVEHGKFPHAQQQPLVYPYLGKAKRLVKGLPEPAKLDLDLRRLAAPEQQQ